MTVQFEIESIFEIKGRGWYVFARLLIAEQNFHLTEKSFLGGVEVNNYLDIPRAKNDIDEQRYDLFSFQIKYPADAHKLKEKQIVELLTG